MRLSRLGEPHRYGGVCESSFNREDYDVGISALADIGFVHGWDFSMGGDADAGVARRTAMINMSERYRLKALACEWFSRDTDDPAIKAAWIGGRFRASRLF
jgi:hypothetical protein